MAALLVGADHHPQVPMTAAYDPLWLLMLALAMAGTGLVSGLMAGLLGVGGGIVIVPVLFNVLPLLGIHPEVQMKLAVATSLATIIPTSIQSARKHYQRRAMDIPLLVSLVPSIVVGVLTGTVLAIWVRGPALSAVFASIAILVAIQLGITGTDFKLTDSFPKGPVRHLLGGAIGTVSAMMGIGGGTVGVPLLNMLGTPIRSAVATSSMFGVIISIPATIGFIWAGWGNPLMPPWSLGFVSLVGFALITPSSLFSTPWGVKLAHTIPPLLLKRLFAAFLAVTAIRMFYSLLA